MAGELARLGALIRQLQGALGGHRFDVQGIVSSSGTVTGSGFSVSKTATGTYQVTYDDAFDADPVLKITPGSTSGLFGARPTAHSATGCTVATFNSSGSALDAEFFFAASG